MGLDSAESADANTLLVFSCKECSGTVFWMQDPDDMEEFNCINSNRPCFEYDQVDAQQISEECEGSGCNHFLHMSCCKRMPIIHLMCSTCLDMGKNPSESDGDDDDDDL